MHACPFACASSVSISDADNTALAFAGVGPLGSFSKPGGCATEELRPPGDSELLLLLLLLSLFLLFLDGCDPKKGLFRLAGRPRSMIGVPARSLCSSLLGPVSSSSRNRTPFFMSPTALALSLRLCVRDGAGVSSSRRNVGDRFPSGGVAALDGFSSGC